MGTPCSEHNLSGYNFFRGGLAGCGLAATNILQRALDRHRSYEHCFELGWFFKHYVGTRNSLFAVVAHGLILVVIFAGLYRINGLDGIPPVLDRGTALYFSVVTWTTLGYGDFRPSESMRLFAALQAALGYIFLGLVVGLSTNLIASTRTAREND